jgi:hypothetical protein
MLPILRILPVGGVVLAVMIVVLALNPLGGSNAAFEPAVFAARGALMQIAEHPEWRQFLVQAALRRAEELNRLRDLPDTPADARKLAGLPVDRSDADPDDETGSINDMPSTTLPIEIGEPSSTELPVTAPKESPPVITTPERVKTPGESRKKGVYRARPSAKALARIAPKPEPASPAGLDTLFGAPPAKPLAVKPPQTRSAKAKPKPAADVQASTPVTGGSSP